jgi:hypothetical protein
MFDSNLVQNIFFYQTGGLYIYIYTHTQRDYKERRQLKTFLTKIGSAIPRTSDPSVICFLKWIRWKDYEVPKNHNLESISAKNELFFSPTQHIPTLRTHRAHLSALAPAASMR